MIFIHSLQDRFSYDYCLFIVNGVLYIVFLCHSELLSPIKNQTSDVCKAKIDNPYKPGILFMGHSQTVQAQIRHHIMLCLIRIFTVCLHNMYQNLKKKKKNTSQHLYNWKWAHPSDKGRQVHLHFSIIYQDGIFLSMTVIMACRRAVYFHCS